MIPDAAIEAAAKCESCRSTGEHAWWCGRDGTSMWKDGR